MTNLPIEERFWSHVDRDGPIPEHCSELGSCWLWKLAVGPWGYGQAWALGKNWRAHRLAYWLTFGPFDLSLQVLHRCDNPPCVNPTHLFLGTGLDNHRDQKEKGRYQSGDRHFLHRHPEMIKRGGDLPWTALTEDDVRRIRSLASTTSMTSVELGVIFGVNKATIKDILHGRTWKHLATVETEALEQRRITLVSSNSRSQRAPRRNVSRDNEIRKEYAAGSASQRELARKYGIHQSNIWRIVHND